VQRRHRRAAPVLDQLRQHRLLDPVHQRPGQKRDHPPARQVRLVLRDAAQAGHAVGQDHVVLLAGLLDQRPHVGLRVAPGRHRAQDGDGALAEHLRPPAQKQRGRRLFAEGVADPGGVGAVVQRDQLDARRAQPLQQERQRQVPGQQKTHAVGVRLPHAVAQHQAAHVDVDQRAQRARPGLDRQLVQPREFLRGQRPRQFLPVGRDGHREQHRGKRVVVVDHSSPPWRNLCIRTSCASRRTSPERTTRA